MTQWSIHLPMQETQAQSLGREDPLEEEMATYSSIIAGENPMNRRAWWAIVHGVAKESEATEFDDDDDEDFMGY